WKGFVSLWISDVEQNHPEIAYENAINGMVSKYSKLKSATAAIIRRRDEIQGRFNTQQRDLQRIQSDLQTAVDTNQDDLSIVLIEKKNALEVSVTELAQELSQAKGDADDAKSSLVSIKSEVEKLKAEKDRMLAKVRSANARIKIQDQLEGLSVDADVQALENVRENIKNTISEANLGKELKDSDLDTRLASLRKQTGASSARAELDALKAARSKKSATKQM
ncbi:MAG: PspA/IM30 family protein, partial [Methylococcales bacterium]